MLHRRLFFSAILLSAIATAALPTPAAAQQAGYTQVIFNLENDGYRVVEMTTTLLGRVRIVARNKIHLREIVVSRATGEIKSDIILQIFAVADGGASATTSKVKGAVPGVPGVTGPGTTPGGTTVSAGPGGVSASTGGASVGVGSGGVSVGLGGTSVGVGPGGISGTVGGLLGN